MVVIAGLGNPGRRYRHTRHNAGFMALERIAELAGIKLRGFGFRAKTGRGIYRGHELFLIKPGTYMNLSGRSIKECLEKLKLPPSSLIVIHDDLDLPLGKIRVKRAGGSGGHKGVASIIHELGTDEFSRIKIGIGRPPAGMDTADYVLSPFPEQERELARKAVHDAAQAALLVVEEGLEAAMNQFN